MSTRTVIEINHDYLHELLKDPGYMQNFLRALTQTHTEAIMAAANVPGVRVLGERHHSETLKLTVK